MSILVANTSKLNIFAIKPKYLCPCSQNVDLLRAAERVNFKKTSMEKNVWL